MVYARRMSTADRVVVSFMNEVRRIRGTGSATDERSYYPAVSQLLSGIGGIGSPKLAVLPEPAGIDGNFPDVALYDPTSQVLVLPVEVKPAEMDMSVLMASQQAKRYALSFGGGRVLLTNLRSVVLAELTPSDQLVETESYQLVAAATDFDTSGNPSDPAVQLVGLIEIGGAEPRGVMADPHRVAKLLAWHGERSVEAIETASVNSGIGVERLLEAVHDLFSDGLDVELEDSFFIPTIVQTLIYGLFAAWLQDAEPEESFDWQGAAYSLNVPVFAELLHACLRPSLVRHCNLLSRLEAAARVLQWTDRTAFAAAFAGGAIEYFYEPFLAAFDPKLRDEMGVWYTPPEIADYQAARVDHHCRTDLSVTGIADPSVIVLDPACGTGTYLLAVLRRIYDSHITNGEPPAIAAARTRDAALQRIVGFELLPAAFVISHLSVGIFLNDLGAPLADGERLRIYLTNSLTGWDPRSALPELRLFPELEDALSHAREVKHREPVLAVIGNPPYHGYSTAASDEEIALVQPWITPLWPDWGVRKHRLNDLYVRFWRIGIERIARGTGRGIVSFITNRQWLGGRSYPTMREGVLDEFDTIRIDDLHGSVHDSHGGTDESVFTTAIASGIRVGTAIVTAVRKDPSAAMSVKIRDFWGSAQGKRDALAALAAGSIDDGLSTIAPTRASRWRLASDAAGDFPAIDEYFDYWVSGVQPVREEAVLSTDYVELSRRMDDFFNNAMDWSTLVGIHPGFGVERARYDGPRTRAKLLASSGFDPAKLVRFLYKPLDARWLYWESHHKLLNEPRRDLMPFFLRVSQQRVLIAPMTRRRPGAARPVAATQVPGFEAGDPNVRVFPLKAPDPHGGTGALFSGSSAAVPNIRDGWLTALRAAGWNGTDLELAGVVFHGLVGVSSSQKWLDEQGVEGDDLPEIPLPKHQATLQAAVDLGWRVADLMDPDVDVAGVTVGSIDPRLASLAVPDAIAGDPVLVEGRQGHSGGRRSGSDVMWDGSGGWRNIPDVVWEYQALGFQVLPKWLAYRVGSRLTAGDREAFMLLARRVAAVQQSVTDADSLYDSAVSAPLEMP